mmetsp:Transcript_74938/g.236880  ORF Transcript_74938/g.236880 Transcript_74938/m.236880 type:complete len:254 (+) Transcript_74938:94-855(+)
MARLSCHVSRAPPVLRAMLKQPIGDLLEGLWRAQDAALLRSAADALAEGRAELCRRILLGPPPGSNHGALHQRSAGKCHTSLAATPTCRCWHLVKRLHQSLASKGCGCQATSPPAWGFCDWWHGSELLGSVSGLHQCPASKSCCDKCTRLFRVLPRSGSRCCRVPPMVRLIANLCIPHLTGMSAVELGSSIRALGAVGEASGGDRTASPLRVPWPLPGRLPWRGAGRPTGVAARTARHLLPWRRPALPQPAAE